MKGLRIVKKNSNRILAISVSILICISMIPVVTFGQTFSELGLQEVNSGQVEINSQIGYISAAEKQKGIEKGKLAIKVMEIREKALKNPNSVTKKDIAVVETYIKKYFKNNTIDMYIPTINEGTGIRSNPGDYQTKNIWVPGQVQQTDYWCGPASGYAVLKDRGINVTQSIMATRMQTTTQGTVLARVAPALNYYNGSNGNYFNYVLRTGPGYYTSTWAMNMTNWAISTILGNYGVIYDCHMVNAPGSARLQGYETMYSAHIYHYVAGEGFNSSDPSNRRCYYYDSNNQKTNLGDRHMNVSFQTMAHLTDDFGIVY